MRLRNTLIAIYLVCLMFGSCLGQTPMVQEFQLQDLTPVQEVQDPDVGQMPVLDVGAVNILFGAGTNYWDLQKPSEKYAAAVKLFVTTNFRGFSGTGFISEYGEGGSFTVVTAGHVVGTGPYVTPMPGEKIVNIYCAFGSLAIDGLKIAAASETDDIAILRGQWIEGPLKKPVPFKIAKDLPKPKDAVTVIGFGGASLLPRIYPTRIGPVANDLDITIDNFVAQGDSGGPVLNANDEVVGIVCRGFARKLTNLQVNNKNAYIFWPGAGVNCKKFRILLDTLKKAD